MVLPDADSAVRLAAVSARRMIAQEIADHGEARLSRHLEIADERGMIVGTLPFARVVTIS